jgi:hypothetical protein
MDTMLRDPANDAEIATMSAPAPPDPRKRGFRARAARRE